MSSISLKLALIAMILSSHFAWADTLGYKTLQMSHFPKVEWLIPQTCSTDRIYIRAKLRQHVTKAQLQVDEQILIQSIGNTQSSSIPTELAQGYQKSYSDIQAFPLTPLRQANSQIQLEWILENSQSKKLTLKGKQLWVLLNVLP